MALDDPEGWDVYREIEAASRSDPLIHVFTNLTGVGNIEVNAFQQLSSLVVQKSIREGFGLVVSEALWKGTPVVAGRAGGIPLQMADGSGGALVDSIDETATAMVDLLRDGDRARTLGERGRERVRDHFLLPRLLLSELVLLNELAGHGTGSALRDPVCGLILDAEAQLPAVERSGTRSTFCCNDCRRRFLTSALEVGEGEQRAQ